MRGAIKSAAPKRRPGLDRRTPLRSPGRFTSPPLRRPCAFRRALHRPTVGLASDYHPTDPCGTLGRSLAALGPLLWRSWAISGALGALLGPPNAPLSSNLHSDKPTWRQHWPQLASQAHFSIDRCPSEPAKSLIFLRKTMVFAGWRCLLSKCAWTAVS